MTTDTTTIAERVASLFGDGTTFQTKDGSSLEKVCHRHDASVQYGRIGSRMTT
jgi:hypothetical protein